MRTRVHVVRNEEELKNVQRLRHKVLCVRLGWLPETADGIETDVWDEKSTHLVAERENGVLGTVRLIHPDHCLLPMEQHWPLPKKVKECSHVEISRIVVDPDNDHEAHAVFLALISGIVRVSEREGIDYWAVALDHIVWRLLAGFGIRFNKIGEPLHYVGSLTIPGVKGYMDLRLELEREDPLIHKILFGSITSFDVEDVERILKGQD